MRATLLAAVLAASVIAVATPVRAQQSLSDSDVLEGVLSGFAAIRNWRYDEATRIAHRLQRNRPEDPTVIALVGAVKLHLGDYQGAVNDMRTAREGGVPDILVSDLVVAESARVATEGYAETVTDHFILRYRPGKDEILVPFAIETLEKAYEQIGDLLGWQPQGRVIVEFYPAASTLARVSSLTDEDIRNSGTIALCKWNRLMVTTPRGVMFGYAWRDTLAHELTHLLIGGASKNTVPIWLHEGIAKFAESAWRAEPGLGLSKEQQERLRVAAKTNKLIPFEKMHPSMAKLPTQEQSSLAFAEVFTFIEYLIQKKGWAGIRKVLAAMSEGATDEQAIAEVYGAPLKKLAKRWMRSLKKRAVVSDGVRAGDRKLVIKENGEVPDDKLHGVSKLGRRYARAADLLYARGRVKAAQKELEKAYEATKSPMVSAKLAVLALNNGDMAAAERAALNAVDGTPDLAGPNVTLAEILLRTGRGEMAWPSIDRAIDINPFDPRIHSLTLALLKDVESSPRKDHASRALSLIAARRPPAPVRLGQGGLIRVVGPTFRRVYLAAEGAEGSAQPTGLLTPTPAFGVKPGRYRMKLVPPFGAPVYQNVQVQPASADGTPQSVTPPADGS